MAALTEFVFSFDVFPCVTPELGFVGGGFDVSLCNLILSIIVVVLFKIWLVF